jgi:hypothetical protein
MLTNQCLQDLFAEEERRVDPILVLHGLMDRAFNHPPS